MEELNAQELLIDLENFYNNFKATYINHLRLGAAISLIKELAEEKESLKQAMEHEHASFMEIFGQYGEKCERLTEENERLRVDNGRYEAENHAQFDKWLKLEEATKRHHAELFEEAKIAVKKDTVRKMRERLKAQKFTHKNFGELVYVEDIDQIAKEMLEGEK